MSDVLNRSISPVWGYCVTDVAFLQLEGQTHHQQKGYYSLDCHTRFIAVAWNQTCNISEVCLYALGFSLTHLQIRKRCQRA